VVTEKEVILSPVGSIIYCDLVRKIHQGNKATQLKTLYTISYNYCTNIKCISL